MAFLSRQQVPTLNLSNELASFSSAYAKSKVLGAVTFALWLYGLIEVALAQFVKLGVIASLGIPALLLVLLGVVAAFYFRSGMGGTESGGCAAGSGEHGCSQVGCDVSNGGCLGKFDREVAERIAHMEKDKLALLLRRKVGYDLFLPLFWIAVGIKLALSSSEVVAIGGTALIIGAAGLMGTRLYLGSWVFRGGISSAE